MSYFGVNSSLGYDERVMLLSPDESQLYTVGYDGDHVGVYEPTMVIVSPDGSYVYAGSDTIGVFARDPVTGLLTYQTNIGDRSTIGFREAEFSSDGKHSYVARNGVALNVYQIDAATGIPSHIDTVAWCCGIDPQQGDHTSQSRPCLPTGRNGARLTPQAGPFRWAST